MWISREINFSNINSANQNLKTAKVTNTSQNKITLQGETEFRNIKTIAPFGIAWVPPLEEEAVALSNSEQSICLGVFAKDKNLKPGEIMLFSSGGASIVLKNDGQVLINGKVVS